MRLAALVPCNGDEARPRLVPQKSPLVRNGWFGMAGSEWLVRNGLDIRQVDSEVL